MPDNNRTAHVFVSVQRLAILYFVGSVMTAMLATGGKVAVNLWYFKNERRKLEWQFTLNTRESKEM